MHIHSPQAPHKHGGDEVDTQDEVDRANAEALDQIHDMLRSGFPAGKDRITVYGLTMCWEAQYGTPEMCRYTIDAVRCVLRWAVGNDRLPEGAKERLRDAQRSILSAVDELGGAS
ncbi:hypothetical protein DTQ13_08670 [Parasaccharibacter sp. TMW 2.1888]|uniref:hypothetical protein n=1 Tax=Parasaccharibacter sp. TMW 2.1888 TaxID=2268025 RepID=UPI00205FFFF9|nr:hypothetical protein [Parasaccharibacter sp. TMW 2.1888]UPO80333.1 hypothetical protein DTQ13_08670 [Parasaccharibacter sp. TMW 2.1888]